MNTSQEQIIGKKHQVPPRSELGSPDSESRVLTITPRDLAVNDGLQIGYSFAAMAGIPVRERTKITRHFIFMVGM